MKRHEEIKLRLENLKNPPEVDEDEEEEEEDEEPDWPYIICKHCSFETYDKEYDKVFSEHIREAHGIRHNMWWWEVDEKNSGISQDPWWWK